MDFLMRSCTWSQMTTLHVVLFTIRSCLGNGTNAEISWLYVVLNCLWGSKSFRQRISTSSLHMVFGWEYYVLGIHSTTTLSNHRLLDSYRTTLFLNVSWLIHHWKRLFFDCFILLSIFLNTNGTCPIEKLLLLLLKQKLLGWLLMLITNLLFHFQFLLSISCFELMCTNPHWHLLT